MRRASIERRLKDVADQARSLREELLVLDEQLLHFEGEADDARLRSLVSETPLAGIEHRQAAKTVAAMRRDNDAHRKRLSKLESKQDALLDGGEGALLWAVDKKTGERLAEYRLPSLPAWDGLAIAGGRLFVTTEDGAVLSFSAVE